MKKTVSMSGFTMVELVTVIVLLGILSAVALPRYLDLQKDARIAALEGVKGAVEDAARLAYAKAVIDGVEKMKRSSPDGDHSIEDGGAYSSTNLGDLELKYGYPEAFAEDGGIDIVDHLELGKNGIDDYDWDVCYSGNATGCFNPKNNDSVRVGIGIKDNYYRECYVRYEEPKDPDPSTGISERETPKITIETDEC